MGFCATNLQVQIFKFNILRMPKFGRKRLIYCKKCDNTGITKAAVLPIRLNDFSGNYF